MIQGASPDDVALIESWLRAIGAELPGSELEVRPDPAGPSLYLRWVSRSVKRQVEVLAPAAPPLYLVVVATASKARRDRSTKVASLPLPLERAEFERAVRAAIAWAERWNAPDLVG